MDIEPNPNSNTETAMQASFPSVTNSTSSSTPFPRIDTPRFSSHPASVAPRKLNRPC